MVSVYEAWHTEDDDELNLQPENVKYVYVLVIHACLQ